jgi:hypothetical protein
VAEELDFEKDGAVRLERAALSILGDIETAIARLPSDKAGVRINDNAALWAILHSEILTSVVGGAFRPVRAILFDKSDTNNWALGWHQDRTIAVRTKVEANGFGPWSRKAGVDHVEPPFELIERMKTVRIHLDHVADDNAPLLIALGSHRLGKVPVTNVPDVIAASKVSVCIASRGDIWLYATSILHASAAAENPIRRRVVQVDYADFNLPTGLHWFHE